MNKDRKHITGLGLLRAATAAFLLVLITFGVALVALRLKGSEGAGSVQTTVGTIIAAEITTDTSTHEAELLSGPETE